MAQQRQQQQQQQRQTQPSQAGGRGTSIQPTRRRSEIATPESVSSPFSMMRRFMEDMDQLFSGFPLGGSIGRGVGELGTRIFVPQLETFERDGRIVIRTDLPGMGKDDVHVQVEGDELVISGERKREHEEKRGGGVYTERSYGSFERRVALPEGCDLESIDASYDNGVLEISIAAPKSESQRARNIEIKGASGQQGEQGKDTSPVH